jgi:hypothetical protein
MDRSLIRQLVGIARGQHGLITARQAMMIGITRDALASAVAQGWLRTVRRSVYAVSGAPESRWQAVMAAALAAGPDAVVSHRSAGAIHGFDGVIDDFPELTVPNECRRRLANVRVHRSRLMAPEDVEARSSVHVTTPLRTVIDLAGSTSDYLLGKILDDGTVRRLWTPDLVASRVDMIGPAGRAGTARLKQLLDLRTGEGPQDGRLEQRVLRALKRFNGELPEPAIHYRVVLDGHVIDMDLAWPEYRIDGEIDGYHPHGQRSDFDRDRLRANLLVAHGWRLVHWTSTMNDEAIVAQILPYFGTS